MLKLRGYQLKTILDGNRIKDQNSRKLPEIDPMRTNKESSSYNFGSLQRRPKAEKPVPAETPTTLRKIKRLSSTGEKIEKVAIDAKTIGRKAGRRVESQEKDDVIKIEAGTIGRNSGEKVKRNSGRFVRKGSIRERKDKSKFKWSPEDRSKKILTNFNNRVISSLYEINF